MSFWTLLSKKQTASDELSEHLNVCDVSWFRQNTRAGIAVLAGWALGVRGVSVLRKELGFLCGADQAVVGSWLNGMFMCLSSADGFSTRSCCSCRRVFPTPGSSPRRALSKRHVQPCEATPQGAHCPLGFKARLLLHVLLRPLLTSQLTSGSPLPLGPWHGQLAPPLLQVWAWLALPVNSFLVLSLDAQLESTPAGCCPQPHMASGCWNLLWTLHGLLLARAASSPTLLPRRTQPCASRFRHCPLMSCTHLLVHLPDGTEDCLTP